MCIVCNLWDISIHHVHGDLLVKNTVQNQWLKIVNIV